LVDDYKQSQKASSAQIESTVANEPEEPLTPTRSTFVGLCAKKLDKNEKCYTPDYYNQFRAQLVENTNTL
jgi:hypothetical protein